MLALSVVTSLCSFHVPSNGQTATYDYKTWGAVSDTLRGVGEGRRVPLSFGFIVPGSDTVRVAGRILDRNEYLISYQLGMLSLKTPVPDGAVVVVGYRRWPFPLDPVYALREIELSSPDSTRPAVARPRRATPETETSKRRLLFGGTKSVSFTVGSNRGTTLDQSLQASIEGELTPTIRVRALLSDNNLPIQPEGNTEELEYLDQVFVEIEGTHAKATLGDFGFQNKVSSFSPFTRQLKGIATEAWNQRGKVSLAGAQSKGVFRTVKFRGQTGIQGPYELLSSSRNTPEVVIAGTERVYMDGEELKRGQNRDYTIDYDRGTVTFTPRRLVTTDSEISVDFEVSQERYDRSTVFGSVSARAGRGVVFKALVAREKDSKNDPRNDTFTPEDIAVLESAGDDPTLALTSGVTATEPGKGEYKMVPADSLAGIPEHFVFDDTTGSYAVSFVEVGVGRGDYAVGGISNRGRPYYEFKGEGLGNYKVGRVLPLPESVELLTARASREQGEHLTFDAEWNVSSYDRNLFSQRDDGDNVGDAGRLRLGMERIPVGVGRLGFTGTVSTIEDRFRSFDKARPSYFYRDWNLENVALVGREVLGEVKAEFSRGEHVGLDYTIGKIDRDEIDGVKHEGTFRVISGEDRLLRGRGFTTDTDTPLENRTRRHAAITTGYGFWKLAPQIVYTRERYLQDAQAEPDSGIAFELVRARIANRGSRLVTASIVAENRDTEETNRRTAGWQDTRRDRTITGELSIRGHDSAQGDLQVTHRVEENLQFGQTRSTDLARIKALFKSSRLGLRSDVDYEISQNESRALERSVIFVGTGKGDYNAQGEQVGKGKGDYTLVYFPTTSTLPTHRVNLAYRLVWKGVERETARGALGWVRANVSLDQTISVSEETTFDPAWKVYLLVPSALQRDDHTLSGTTSIRQDWSLLGGYPNISLTVRYQRDDEEENRFEGVREERFFGQHLVRLSRSVSPMFTLTGEVSREVRKRGGVGIAATGGSTYDVESRSGLGGVGVRLSSGSSVDVDLKVSGQDDAVSGSRQVVVDFAPRTVWRLTRVISVFGSYELTRVWDRREVSFRPLFFDGEGNSHRWTVTPNVRVSKMISVVATYHGRRETTFAGERVTEHELKLETRAYF